jgi:glycosyltransferase involved in cell wall biosynthesis
MQTEQTRGSVSVALCTFNGSRYLPEQLASIASQTRKPGELVVCDDGSSDRTVDILREFATTAGFPVRIHQNERNIGSTKNFEKAIGLCNGTYIALADQDDWWKPNKLEKLVQVLRDSSGGAVFSDGVIMDENSVPTSQTLWGQNRFGDRDNKFNSQSGEGARSVLLRCNVVTGATLMFRSNLRGVLGPFPQEWVHDGWMAWMIVFHSRLIAFSEPLIQYRTHRGQQVGIPGRSMIDRLRRAKATGMREYLELERQLEVLCEYAETHADVCSREMCHRLEEKRALLQFRAAPVGSRLRRWRGILSNAGRYRLYAQSWQSMFKDALV